ncbi:hypoxanthine-guanine phosphoribosyltransferase [Puccinia graminis f. sp. tritici]|uniref:Hypoxanthine-guanine phosphoribosyltransferase n=1 Tax=Puccinia graminis f. sp. tritici TaxID=56615 RepID=A0A5B0PSI2_PUCGR|nr:hypoxanthine-guanine phosphoribosyltransferase [Puccinia graminis f. sp. tritici]
MTPLDQHVRLTYEDIHRTIADASETIRDQFGPEIMIAIGGGGFFPARVLVAHFPERFEQEKHPDPGMYTIRPKAGQNPYDLPKEHEQDDRRIRLVGSELTEMILTLPGHRIIAI